MDINLEYFKIFYYVAKTGSITAAAKELHISQPAVSQAIRNFEESLGGTVFVRSAKGVSLTQEGKSLYYHVSRGYEQIENGVKQYEALKNLSGGMIRLGASDMTLRFYILQYLEEFCEKYPQIKVSVTNAPTPKTLGHLEKGNIDFGVVSTPFSAKEKYCVIPVREIEDVFVVGEKYKKLAEEVQEYSILEKYPYICLGGETSSKAYVDEFLASRGVSVKPEFALATSDMMISFAKRGFGISCIVKDFVQEEIDKGELFELRFTESIPKREFAIVYDEKQMMSKAAQELLAHMTKEHIQ